MYVIILIALIAFNVFAGEPKPTSESPESTTKSDPAPKNAVKVPETIRAVPIQVTATRLSPEQPSEKQASTSLLTYDEIEHGQLQTVRDISRVVPNFLLNEGGDRRSQLPVMRGLINNTFGNPGVIAYVDDVPITEWRALNLDLFDAERILVYRGPVAETTHGASAATGLIDINTIQPGNKLEARGSVSYGNYNAQVYRAAVGGPIVKDKIMFRIAAIESKRDGYLKNTFHDVRPDHRDNLAGRLQLRFTPTPELEIGLTAEGQRANDGTQTYVPFPAVKSFKLASDVRGGMDLDAYLGALKIAYTVPSFKFTSITSRRAWESDDYSADLDFTPTPLLALIDEYDFVQWSQEFRVKSLTDQGPWTWQTGAYFEDRTTSNRFGTTISDTAFIQAPPPAGLGLPFTAPVIDRRDTHLYTQTWAALGQVTYTAWDKLELTFGARYEFRRDEMESEHNLLAPAQQMTTFLASSQGKTQSHVFLPKFAASYEVTKALSVYTTVGRGYRPGGFSYLVDDPVFQKWLPEHLWNYEIGVKSRWLDDRLAFNLSLFDMEVSDYQVRRQSALSFRVDNANRVSSRGFEAAIVASPLKGLELTANFGYADARFENYSDRVNGENFEGNALALVPNYTFATTAQYRHDIGVFIRAEYQGNGGYAFAESNTGKQRPFELLNAKFGYERKNYGVFLYGKNLIDQTYSYFGLPGASVGLVGSPGDPRVFGIMFEFKF